DGEGLVFERIVVDLVEADVLEDQVAEAAEGVALDRGQLEAEQGRDELPFAERERLELEAQEALVLHVGGLPAVADAHGGRSVARAVAVAVRAVAAEVAGQVAILYRGKELLDAAQRAEAEPSGSERVAGPVPRAFRQLVSEFLRGHEVRIGAGRELERRVRSDGELGARAVPREGDRVGGQIFRRVC